MARQGYNIEGGEHLSRMGASWFVSYSYWLHIDKTAINWERVPTLSTRINNFERSKEHHRSLLEFVLQMNDKRLNLNKIGLDAAEVKQMARRILDKV